MTPTLITIVSSLLSAIVVAVATALVTYFFTKRREHEADWRKLKFSQYQEFVLALSEIVEGQSTHEKQIRYANAVNSMSLVAPIPVLNALRDFQDEISYKNTERSDERHDLLLNVLFNTLRSDVHPSSDPKNFKFRLLAPPPTPQ